MAIVKRTVPKKKSTKKKETPNQKIAKQGGTAAALAKRQRKAVGKGERTKFTATEQRKRNKASKAKTAKQLSDMRAKTQGKTESSKKYLIKKNREALKKKRNKRILKKK